MGQRLGDTVWQWVLGLLSTSDMPPSKNSLVNKQKEFSIFDPSVWPLVSLEPYSDVTKQIWLSLASQNTHLEVSVLNWPESGSQTHTQPCPMEETALASLTEHPTQIPKHRPRGDCIRFAKADQLDILQSSGDTVHVNAWVELYPIAKFRDSLEKRGRKARPIQE